MRNPGTIFAESARSSTNLPSSFLAPDTPVSHFFQTYGERSSCHSDGRSKPREAETILSAHSLSGSLVNRDLCASFGTGGLTGNQWVLLEQYYQSLADNYVKR